MAPVNFPHLSAAFAAAFLAGAINSVAGGGTLVSFPTLLWLGLPSVIANATSTVALWPGSLGSIWGFRREFQQTSLEQRLLAIPSLIGGGLGALLLRQTPSSVFDRIVPFLVLFATTLFTLRGVVQRHVKMAAAEGKGAQPAHHSASWLAGAWLFQFLVGIYGGYFGAGIGIMGLSTLSILGMTDIFQMNALTSFFGLCINGVAILLFIAAKLVYWPYVLVMAAGSLIGGYGAAGVARRIGATAVRRFVIVVGFTMAAILFVRMFGLTH